MFLAVFMNGWEDQWKKDSSILFYQGHCIFIVPEHEGSFGHLEQKIESDGSTHLEVLTGYASTESPEQRFHYLFEDKRLDDINDFLDLVEEHDL